jgi:hypothetical protein
MEWVAAPVRDLRQFIAREKTRRTWELRMQEVEGDFSGLIWWKAREPSLELSEPSLEPAF